jgi:hypothetical protein
MDTTAKSHVYVGQFIQRKYNLRPKPCHSSNGYNRRHQTACFKATVGLHPYSAALSQQYSVASFSELSSLVWAPLFVLQRCTILLWPWSMQLCDHCKSRLILTAEAQVRSKAVHVEFVVDNAALGQVIFSESFGFTLSISLRICFGFTLWDRQWARWWPQFHRDIVLPNSNKNKSLRAAFSGMFFLPNFLKIGLFIWKLFRCGET